MVKVCLECGKEFKPGGTNPNHAIYCSVYCGTVFETTRSNQVCCGPECVKERGRRRSRENGKMYRVKYKEEKNKAKAKSTKEEAWEIEAEARKRGMNYGMYYAMLQMEKERAKRLRGTA